MQLFLERLFYFWAAITAIGLLIVVVAISIITTFLKSNLLFSKEYISTLLFSKNFEEYKNYSFLAQTNILIIIIWVLSTFHYLTIFRLGAVQLIAFQFTVSVFSLYKSNKTTTGIYYLSPIVI